MSGEPFGGKTFALQQQPSLLALSQAEAFLREMLNRSALFGKRSRPDALQQDLWTVLATQAALPETQQLTASDQQSLLAQLEQLDLDNRSLDGSPSGFPYPLLNWNVNFDSAFEQHAKIPALSSSTSLVAEKSTKRFLISNPNSKV